MSKPESDEEREETSVTNNAPKPESGPPTCYCPGCGRPFWSAELYEAHYEEAHGSRFFGGPLQPSGTISYPRKAAPLQEQDVTVANVYRGKNLQIIGGILIVVGGLIFVAVIVNDSSSTVARFIAALTAAVGIALYLGGRFEHWYHSE